MRSQENQQPLPRNALFIEQHVTDNSTLASLEDIARAINENFPNLRNFLNKAEDLKQIIQILANERQARGNGSKPSEVLDNKKNPIDILLIASELIYFVTVKNLQEKIWPTASLVGELDDLENNEKTTSSAYENENKPIKKNELNPLLQWLSNNYALVGILGSLIPILAMPKTVHSRIPDENDDRNQLHIDNSANIPELLSASGLDLRSMSFEDMFNAIVPLPKLTGENGLNGSSTGELANIIRLMQDLLHDTAGDPEFKDLTALVTRALENNNENQAEEETTTFVVFTGTVNFRTGPGTDFAKDGQSSNGQIAELINKVGDGDSLWLEIKINGKTIFVAGFLDEVSIVEFGDPIRVVTVSESLSTFATQTSYTRLPEVTGELTVYSEDENRVLVKDTYGQFGWVENDQLLAKTIVEESEQIEEETPLSTVTVAFNWTEVDEPIAPGVQITPSPTPRPTATPSPTATPEGQAMENSITLNGVDSEGNPVSFKIEDNIINFVDLDLDLIANNRITIVEGSYELWGINCLITDENGRVMMAVQIPNTNNTAYVAVEPGMKARDSFGNEVELVTVARSIDTASSAPAITQLSSRLGIQPIETSLKNARYAADIVNASNFETFINSANSSELNFQWNSETGLLEAGTGINRYAAVTNTANEIYVARISPDENGSTITYETDEDTPGLASFSIFTDATNQDVIFAGFYPEHTNDQFARVQSEEISKFMMELYPWMDGYNVTYNLLSEVPNTEASFNRQEETQTIVYPTNFGTLIARIDHKNKTLVADVVFDTSGMTVTRTHSDGSEEQISYNQLDDVAKIHRLNVSMFVLTIEALNDFVLQEEGIDENKFFELNDSIENRTNQSVTPITILPTSFNERLAGVFGYS